MLRFGYRLPVMAGMIMPLIGAILAVQYMRGPALRALLLLKFGINK